MEELFTALLRKLVTRTTSVREAYLSALTRADNAGILPADPIGDGA